METHSFAAFVLPLATNELCQWSLCAPKMLLTVLDVRPQFKACSCDCLINTERVKDGKAINGIPRFYHRSRHLYYRNDERLTSISQVTFILVTMADAFVIEPSHLSLLLGHEMIAAN